MLGARYHFGRNEDIGQERYYCGRQKEKKIGFHFWIALRVQASGTRWLRNHISHQAYSAIGWNSNLVSESYIGMWRDACHLAWPYLGIGGNTGEQIDAPYSPTVIMTSLLLIVCAGYRLDGTIYGVLSKCRKGSATDQPKRLIWSRRHTDKHANACTRPSSKAVVSRRENKRRKELLIGDWPLSWIQLILLAYLDEGQLC